MVNYKTLLNHAKDQCKRHNIETMRAEWLMLDLFEWTKADLLMHMQDTVPEAHVTIFEVATKRMLKNEPIQYIVGKQSFYGETFKVNEHCLIPRPETEEVMLHLYKQLHTGDTIVDIGTGSGNIPITLKKLDASFKVYATDLYEAPLLVAQENAKTHQVDISFLQGDALAPLIERGIKVNGLISNPPYIDDSEAVLMDEHVLKYEPHTALFAQDKGYRVYDTILDQLPYVLLPQAKVVFEIGFNQGETLKRKILTKYPNLEVEIVKDINQNDRIISFVW
ncbi:peptide chain release factor N(5)-glutamine methyltransferase [Staphylococcus caeli]|uniref:peptide chain release factor N(5)-glutamine methyltransferase n=1 Tax=Staphylococcus caeli TaxID=2201815 RepID=UPI003F5630F1